MKLTHEWLKDHLDYDPEGYLILKKQWAHRLQVGHKIGYVNGHGYRTTTINRVFYGVHSLVWFWHFGYLPKELDHIDHNPLNNKIENLREVTRSENNQNMVVRVENNTGIKGVMKRCNKYRAKLVVGGRFYLSSHNTLGEAVAARKIMEEKYHPYKSY